MIMKSNILMALFCLSSAVCSSEAPLVVLMEFQKEKDIIHIDGVVTAKEKMYEALIKPLSLKGRKTEVKVLFNPNISFSEVVNTKGIIQAVGFSDIKFYYLSDDKKKMAEIEFNKPAIVVPAGFVN